MSLLGPFFVVVCKCPGYFSPLSAEGSHILVLHVSMSFSFLNISKTKYIWGAMPLGWRLTQG